MKVAESKTSKHTATRSEIDGGEVAATFKDLRLQLKKERKKFRPTDPLQTKLWRTTKQFFGPILSFHIINSIIILPVQITPLLEYPILQLQVKLPTVLLQTAFTSQLL